MRLTSPGGTQLGLAWIGEYTEVDWVLDCRDYSHGVVGTLNSWQLRITYDDAVATENESWGDIKALYR